MRLAIAVEQAAEAIVITDREFRIVYVNPAFERVSGYTSDELVGTNPRQRQSGRHGPEFYEAMWSTLRAGGIWRGTLFNLRKDGGYILSASDHFFDTPPENLQHFADAAKECVYK